MKNKNKSTFWKDFKAFISRGNVVDMAIGVAVATAFTAIVTKFTAAFISPLLALLTGNVGLAEMKYVIREAVMNADGVVTTPEIAITWGAFLLAVIDFLIIAFVLFIVLRVFTRASKKAKEIREGIKEDLKSPETKAAEAQAAAEAIAKAEAAAKAAEEARLAAEAEIAAAKEREVEVVALLRDIRDNLAEKK